jgi:hypothetical protein
MKNALKLQKTQPKYFDKSHQPMFNKLDSILLSLGLRKHPSIKTTQQLVDFVTKQSAYVSQVTLYTYVKARSGTQHVKLFENETFLTSLKIARWHIFGAAVSDLSLFAAAQMFITKTLSDEETKAFAKHLMTAILNDYDQQDIEKAEFDKMLVRGQQRADSADWAFIATGPTAFQASSDAVFRWAPIADELKQDDEEIVRNSIHLRWIGVRRDVKELLRPAAIAATL